MKNLILFLGSLCFYAWGKPVYAVLLLFVTLLDFLQAQLIDRYRGKAVSRIFFLTAVFIHLGFLGLFFYGDFAVGILHSLFAIRWSGWEVRSFGMAVYTLQALSYLIDVYRGEVKARNNILEYGVYVIMFPQLPAGPVVKYREAEPFLHSRKMDIAQISSGVKRACVGLAKKVLIADAAGELWSEISAAGFGNLSAAAAWLGVLAFAFHMYFTFSGYSDMALGLAACLGFSFPENFHYPFMARSVTEFCRNWNQSLGRWFREYVYLPLGGNRKGPVRQSLVVALVWALTGLWYGADRTFLLWGLWLALFLLLEKWFLKKLLRAMPGALSWLYTTVVAALGWVLFAVDDLAGAGAYLLAMFGQNSAGIWDNRFGYLALEYLPVLVIGVIASTPIVSGMAERLRSRRSGLSMALYRLGEKVIPGALLLLSMIWIIGTGR